jgi:hypothetical protein
VCVCVYIYQSFREIFSWRADIAQIERRYRDDIDSWRADIAQIERRYRDDIDSNVGARLGTAT